MGKTGPGRKRKHSGAPRNPIWIYLYNVSSAVDPFKNDSWKWNRGLDLFILYTAPLRMLSNQLEASGVAPYHPWQAILQDFPEHLSHFRCWTCLAQPRPLSGVSAPRRTYHECVAGARRGHIYQTGYHQTYHPGSGHFGQNLAFYQGFIMVFTMPKV